MFLAQKAKMVYGVEIVPEAILDAKENAALNGIQNVEFMTGAAEDVLPAFYNSSRSKGEAKASSKVADKKEAEDVITSYSIHYTKLYDVQTLDALRGKARKARKGLT